MIFAEIKEQDHVHDARNPIVLGVVTKKFKTRVKVWFGSGVARSYTATYMASECRHLVKE